MRCALCNQRSSKRQWNVWLPSINARKPCDSIPFPWNLSDILVLWVKQTYNCQYFSQFANMSPTFPTMSHTPCNVSLLNLVVLAVMRDFSIMGFKLIRREHGDLALPLEGSFWKGWWKRWQQQAVGVSANFYLLCCLQLNSILVLTYNHHCCFLSSQHDWNTCYQCWQLLNPSGISLPLPQNQPGPDLKLQSVPSIAPQCLLWHLHLLWMDDTKMINRVNPSGK